MNLTEFLDSFDREGFRVLLEGKRKVLPQDEDKLRLLGSLLAERSRYIVFRSGNAPGADALFSAGIAGINPNRLEVILPYGTHRRTGLLTPNVHSLDEINLLEEEEIVYQSKSNRKMAGLIDRFVSGETGHIALKASYILRDTVKVIGSSQIPAVNFAIFYDDLMSPHQGGTGHTMQICEKNGIPFIDQAQWMAWL